MPRHYSLEGVASVRDLRSSERLGQRSHRLPPRIGMLPSHSAIWRQDQQVSQADERFEGSPLRGSQRRKVNSEKAFRLHPSYETVRRFMDDGPR